MTLEVDYLPFATGGSANVLDQTDYAAASFVTNGFSAGIAQSNQLNKVWRQSSMAAAALAGFISQTLNISVLDDGNLANLISELQSAVVVGAGIRPSSLITASANYNVSASQYRVMFARTASPAAISVQLPTLLSGAIGQSFRIGDVSANAGAYPITVLPPSGQTLGSATNFVIASNNQVVEFCWLGSNLWSVEQ